MGVVVLEADQAEDRRPNVRMIAEDLAEGAPLKHAGTDHAEPGLGDFLLEVAVVPSEAGVFDKAALEVGRIGRVAQRHLRPGREEIVGIGEQNEIGRALRIAGDGDHVQQILLGLIGERLRHLIGAAVRPVDDIEPQ